MVDIQITNTQLAKYEINFEQAKEYLQSELQKYQNLVVSEEFMQMAKKSRAELNAKRKELQSRFTEVKKKHNEPIDMLKTKVDELLGLIDEPLNKIDEQIKRYEIEVKKDDRTKEFQKKYGIKAFLPIVNFEDLSYIVLTIYLFSVIIILN